MSRDRDEHVLWAYTHPRYRSREANGTRRIVMVDAQHGGYVHVPLAALSDADLAYLARRRMARVYDRVSRRRHHAHES